MRPSAPPDERSRVTELHSLGLLDSPAEERFDRVTRLAQQLFDVPIALVTLVDTDRQWFKSSQGIAVSETPRSVSFCSHAILQDDVMQVRDATADPKFADNPLVTSEPQIRFYAGCPINGPGGAKLGTLCIIAPNERTLSADELDCLRDLASIVEREIAFARLATVDELTGLSNRRGFELFGAKMLELCRRQALAATLLFVDLDGFKAINDDFGHDQGDLALIEFARTFEATFRESDIVARFGGDEFVTLLTQASSADGAASRVRDALASESNTASASLGLSVSIGTAEFDPTSNESLEQLVKRADTAMYRDKQRNPNWQLPA